MYLFIYLLFIYLFIYYLFIYLCVCIYAIDIHWQCGKHLWTMGKHGETDHIVTYHVGVK